MVRPSLTPSEGCPNPDVVQGVLNKSVDYLAFIVLHLKMEAKPTRRLAANVDIATAARASGSTIALRLIGLGLDCPVRERGLEACDQCILFNQLPQGVTAEDQTMELDQPPVQLDSQPQPPESPESFLG
jgi:hypothetical protein